MDIVINAVLIGLFLIIIIWLFVALNKNNNPPVTPPPNNGRNSVSFKIPPISEFVIKPKPPAPPPSEKVLINAYFHVFVHNLFDLANGNKIDMEESIKNLVSILCHSDTHKAKETLTDYVDELKVLLKTYEEGVSVSQWVGRSSNSSVSCGDTQSVSNADQIEKIRYLSNKLNGEFEGCVRFDGGHLGILFGILATNIIAYGKNVKDGDFDQASIIRQRVMSYVEKVN